MPANGNEQSNMTKRSFALIGERLLTGVLDRFSSPHHGKRNRFLLLFITAIILTLTVLPGQQLARHHYRPGDIATADIRATQDYLLEDRILTDKKRAEAEAAIPYVYDFNTTAAQELTRRFEKAIALTAAARSGNRQEDRETLRAALDEILGLKLEPAEAAAFFRIRSDRALMADINHINGIIFSNKIVADGRLFSADLAHGVVMQDCRTCESIATLDRAFAAIDLPEARRRLAGMRLSAGAEARDLALIKGVLVRSVQPNLSLNREATEQRKQSASISINPVLYQLKRGEMIVRSGERVNEEQVRRLDQIYSGRYGVARLVNAAGVLCLILILFYFPYRFARKNIRKFSPGNKDLLLLVMVTLFTFSLLRIGLMVSTAMGGLFPQISNISFAYLFPFAAGPMLIRIILNSEVALVYCAVCAPIAGIMFEGSLPIVIYSLMGGVIGAHGVRQCMHRGVIYTAGLKISVVNVALALTFQLFGEGLFTVQTLYAVIFALIGGLVNATLVTGIIPAIESMFQYTTDMKLLEYSNLNVPLLHNLMVQAPGTYHHSVLVGNLVEAAAEMIHANPLLARVAAYYHDVGKVSKPLYFIENTKGGENRHDKLSPSMSALILISHVKEGVELAREHRLGPPIIDIIRQSHGTSLITYFHQKAKNQASDPLSVSERDFRYPGPKPQTREAGLVLLADAVEAACRTLGDPTPARIQGLVQKIINNIFIDGQLDECELTLKDLHEIAKSFNRVLNGIYHHRIDYPEPAFKEKSAGWRKPVEDRDIEQPAPAPDIDSPPQKGDGEDLKRLGIGR